MKKLFMIGLAATAMLASCSNDETMEMAQQKAIGFSNAFVNNGTRSIVDPSFTKKLWKTSPCMVSHRTVRFSRVTRCMKEVLPLPDGHTMYCSTGFR